LASENDIWVERTVDSTWEEEERHVTAFLNLPTNLVAGVFLVTAA